MPTLINLLESLPSWTEASIKEALLAFVPEQGLKNGQVLWPLRALLT